MFVSDRTSDHFDAVAPADSDSLFWEASPERWPDDYNDWKDKNGEVPPVKRIPTSSFFIASQSDVNEQKVARYARDLKRGDCLPPIICIKTPDGIVVWNGHHRLCAHRLAGRKTIKVRFYGSVDQSIIH